VPHRSIEVQFGKRSPLVRTQAAVAVALALVCGSQLKAAPAPSEEIAAKSRLESLRKKLPGVLEEAVNKSDKWTRQFEASVQSLRMIGPAEAKLTIKLSAVSNTGTKDTQHDEVVVVYLSCFDATWTTRRFEATWTDPDFAPGRGPAGGAGVRGNGNSRGARFLMAAIDEATEKEE
jgi:hypothetical protein